jgi:hypothetical protein
MSSIGTLTSAVPLLSDFNSTGLASSLPSVPKAIALSAGLNRVESFDALFSAKLNDDPLGINASFESLKSLVKDLPADAKTRLNLDNQIRNEALKFQIQKSVATANEAAIASLSAQIGSQNRGANALSAFSDGGIGNILGQATPSQLSGSAYYSAILKLNLNR